MASLAQHPNSPYWIGCFTEADGRQLKRITKIRIAPEFGDKTKPAELKRQALMIARTWEAATRKPYSEAQIENVLIAIQERLRKQKIPRRIVPTVRLAVASWIDRKTPEVEHIGETALTEAMSKMPDITTSKEQAEKPESTAKSSIHHKARPQSTNASLYADAPISGIHGTCTSATFTF